MLAIRSTPTPTKRHSEQTSTFNAAYKICSWSAALVKGVVHTNYRCLYAINFTPASNLVLIVKSELQFNRVYSLLSEGFCHRCRRHRRYLLTLKSSNYAKLISPQPRVPFATPLTAPLCTQRTLSNHFHLHRMSRGRFSKGNHHNFGELL